jgi:hypothetical protein
MPGLHRAQQPPDRLWYAAYGSNLKRERLMCYLRGGRPAGGLVSAGAAGDPSEPSADVAIELSHRLYFAAGSGAWGRGGVAFIEPQPQPGACTLARAWRLSRAQFEHVLAQENRLRPGEVEVDYGRLLGDGRLLLGRGLYRLVLRPGMMDGLMVVTFTRPDASTAHRLGPGDAYRRTIAAGLRESRPAMSAEQIEAYLDGAIGQAPGG